MFSKAFWSTNALLKRISSCQLLKPHDEALFYHSKSHLFCKSSETVQYKRRFGKDSAQYDSMTTNGQRIDKQTSEPYARHGSTECFGLRTNEVV